LKIEICDEQADRIVVDSLKSNISLCERPDDNLRETNDNKAHLLSALYRILEYCTTEGEYREFVEGMKSARNSL
jgi:hypothetical protein